ncbi:hypothetical protein Tco_1407968 [Tanacetum coccineum]
MSPGKTSSPVLLFLVVSMNTCNLDSNINVIPEMPVPISGNPNLSHKPNENKSPNKVSVGEVKEPVMFKVNGDSSDIAEGVGSVRNFEVGETSRGENVVGREVSDRDPGYCWSFEKDVEGVSIGRGDKSKSYVFFYFKSDDGMANVSQRVYQMVPGSLIISKTTSICERSYWRVSFARVLVEVDATKGLVDGVEVWYKSLGKSLMLNVEYAWVPPLCEHSRIFGHFISACGKRDQTVLKSGDKVEANMSSTNKTVNVENDSDGWQNVVNRRNGRGGMSYYRQGSTNFNHNRGGGMSGRGRGYYASRFKPNNVNNGVNIGNKQYVPVNWNIEKVIIVDESMVANEVKKNDDSDENKQNLRGTRKVSGNGKTGGIKLKGSVENRNINTRNRFEVLGEENESEVSDSWKEVKIHVDVACDMGIPVSKILLVIELKLTKISDLDAEIEHLEKNLLVNAGMNAQRMVNDSEEATGEKVNGLYEKFFYQTYKVEVLKVKD